MDDVDFKLLDCVSAFTVEDKLILESLLQGTWSLI